MIIDTSMYSKIIFLDMSHENIPQFSRLTIFQLILSMNQNSQIILILQIEGRGGESFPVPPACETRRVAFRLWRSDSDVGTELDAS